MADVQIGQHKVAVVPQPIPYLEERLGRFFPDLAKLGGDIDAESVLGALGENTYEVLCILIPELGEKMPVYEFRGFPSRETYEEGAGRTEESARKGPSFDQLVTATQTVIAVNRFDEIKRIADWAGKALGRLAEQFGIDQTKLQEAFQTAFEQERSSTTPSPNGASGSTKDFEQSPTAPPSAD